MHGWICPYFGSPAEDTSTKTFEQLVDIKRRMLRDGIPKIAVQRLQEIIDARVARMAHQPEHTSTRAKQRAGV